MMTVKSTYEIDQSTWCDEVSSMLAERKMSVVNATHDKVIDAVNLTIMDLAVKYVEENQLSATLIPPINHMRHYKKMILPCEVIGMSGRSKTFQFECLEAPS